MIWLGNKNITEDVFGSTQSNFGWGGGIIKWIFRKWDRLKFDGRQSSRERDDDDKETWNTYVNIVLFGFTLLELII